MDLTMTRVGSTDPTTSRTTTFRRRAGAAAVLLAPIAFAAAEVSWPSLEDEASPAAMLERLAAHHGQLLLAVYAGLVSAVLFIPAVFALMNPVRRRGTVLTHLGGGMTLLGTALSGLALAGLQFIVYEASAPGVDRAAVAPFLDHALEDPVGAPLPMGHYLFAFGLVVLAAGLYRSRAGYRWASAAFGAGPLLDSIWGSAGLPESLAIEVVTDLLFLAGAAGLAWWHLTTSNASWESAAVPTPRRASASS